MKVEKKTENLPCSNTHLSESSSSLSDMRKKGRIFLTTGLARNLPQTYSIGRTEAATQTARVRIGLNTPTAESDP